jgi:glutathione S-transferase
LPVLKHVDLRLVETIAILRYLNDAFAGPSFVPGNVVDRARMDMAMGLYDSYGYGAMARVVGARRFPAFVGHPTGNEVDAAVEQLRTLARELARIRNTFAFLAGDTPTLADFLVAPACFYLELVQEGTPVLAEAGFDTWWRSMREHDAYRAAIPDLADWGEN